MADAPTAEEILAASAEALESSVKHVRHADKGLTYRSPKEIGDALALADQLNNGPQYYVVARPKRPKL